MSKAEATSSAAGGFIPAALAFPLLIIAFQGCWQGGCQGALNAQSTAVHKAIEAGGWIDGKENVEGAVFRPHIPLTPNEALTIRAEEVARATGTTIRIIRPVFSH